MARGKRRSEEPETQAEATEPISEESEPVELEPARELWDAKPVEPVESEPEPVLEPEILEGLVDLTYLGPSGIFCDDKHTGLRWMQGETHCVSAEDAKRIEASIRSEEWKLSKSHGNRLSTLTEPEVPEPTPGFEVH